jgi:hypothetical protein
MGLGSFVVVLLWCGSGFVVVKRGELTVVWRGEGRDWRGVSLICGGFFRCGGGRALGMGFWGGICQVSELSKRIAERQEGNTPGLKPNVFAWLRGPRLKPWRA